MKRKEIQPKIGFNGYWQWIQSPKNYDYDITGKYLFFSEDKQRLMNIAMEEIKHHDFHIAKVNSELVGNNKEHVLCLYYKDNSRKDELADRVKKQYPDVKYRYWKSDEQTLSGQYSKEFLNKLDDDTRRRYTSKKTN